MTGPKLNEKSFVAGERSGTKASARNLRVSAYKAREVLNLIRNLPVRQADEVLQFTDRGVSDDIRKVLASAVANAVNNEQQDADELYVKACFADEGATMKRFAARARGRGTRIRKRTCHITVVVARLDDDRLEVVQAREAKRTAAGRRRAASGGAASSRRARVERSRQRATAAKAGDTVDTETTSLPSDDAVVDAVEFAGAVRAEGDEAPEGFDIKGNAQSMKYHVPGSRYYNATKAEYWFDSVESAEAAGFSVPGQKASADDVESDESSATPAGAEGSASDEAQAAQGESAADDEPAANASDEEDNS
jgi:large subunit ribosomal protein L22